MNAPLPYWVRGQSRRSDETPEDHEARLEQMRQQHEADAETCDARIDAARDERAAAPKRPVGRPPLPGRVLLKLPEALLDGYGNEAARVGRDRAALMREDLAAGLERRRAPGAS